MLVLFETPAGYAIFKITDEKKLQEPADIAAIFADKKSADKLYFLLNSQCQITRIQEIQRQC